LGRQAAKATARDSPAGKKVEAKTMKKTISVADKLPFEGLGQRPGIC